jgi:hypothetical protein
MGEIRLVYAWEGEVAGLHDEINRLRAYFEKIRDDYNVNHSSKWCLDLANRALKAKSE